MKRITKVLGLCAVMVLAFAAFAVASASAASPEYIGWCYEDAEGQWQDSECSVPAPPSEFENVHFTSTSGEGMLIDVNGNSVFCEKDRNEGQLTGPKTDEVTIWFEGCFTEFFGGKLSCTTENEPAGTIKTEANSYLVKDPTTGTILDLLYPKAGTFPPPQPPNGTLFAKFRCGGFFGQNVEVRGSVLGRVEPTGKFSNTGSLVLNQSAGVQEYTEYETESGEVRTAYLESQLGTSGFNQAGETTTDTITYDNGREVKVE